MHAPRRPLRKTPLVDHSGDAGAAESGLLEAFALRRRRMEAASRIAEEMRLGVAAIGESSGASALPPLREDVSPASSVQQGESRAFTDSFAKEKGPNAQFSNALEISSPHDAIKQETRQKVKKIHQMRMDQHEAAEAGRKPEFLLEDEMETNDLPDKFSSSSIAYILESLAISQMKIITATDDIMLALSRLDRDITPPIFKPMNALAVQSRHAMKCYKLTLQHLKQYEECEKALLDGSAQELGCMREQFLVRKEVLTAQEQKQKVLDDQVQSLRLRVNAADSWCQMWATTLMAANTLAPPTSFTPTPPDRPFGSVQTEALSLMRTTSLLKNSDRFNSSRASITGSFLRRQSGAFTETPNALQPSVSPTLSDEVVDSSHGEVSAQDAMELRVSQFWCNPYIIKAKQCAAWRQPTQQNPLIVDLSRVNTSPSFVSSEPLPATRHSLSRPLNEGGHSIRDAVVRVGNMHEANAHPQTEVRLAGLLRELLRSLGPCMSPTANFSSSDMKNTDEMSGGSCKRSSEQCSSGVTTPTKTQSDGKYNPAFRRNTSVDALEADVTLDGPELAALSESTNNILRFLEMVSSNGASTYTPNV